MKGSAIAVGRAAVGVVIYAVIGAMVLFVVGYELSDANAKPMSTYRAAFTDVSGLRTGANVRVAGVPVGKVTEIDLDGRGNAVVTFTVQQSRRLPATARAVIRYKNLIGQRYLEVRRGAGSSGWLKPGSTIPPSRTQPALDLDALLGGFRPLFEGLQPGQINTLASELISVLQGQGGTVESLLGHIASFTNNLANRDKVIGSLVENLNSVLRTLNENGTNLSQTIIELERLVTGLAERRGVVGEAITEVNSLTQTLGSFLSAARPPIRDTIRHARRLTKILAEHDKEVDRFLTRLPQAYYTMYPAGSHGTFFNFYLCGVRFAFTGPDGQPEYTPNITSNKSAGQRCQYRDYPIDAPFVEASDGGE